MSERKLDELVTNCHTPKYKSQVISVSHDESGETKLDDTSRIDESVKLDLINSINKNLEDLELKLHSVEFEKDNDANFHVDFLTACSNLRARNYRIAESTRLQVKVIAGKIIPAVVTTTSAIVSLNSLELLKIVKGCDVRLLKNHALNLSSSFFAPWMPDKDQPVARNENANVLYEFSEWDQIKVSLGASCAIGGFIDAVMEECSQKCGHSEAEVYSVQSPDDEEKEL
eukprot:TRINITY_DN1561_c1_g1_i2.p1 TRINITY_DN1561_c1_g1~~TRINITY_DN1561_c1_g1_i2.p1  ORF type:complete len:256 (-),score=49.00 TRINITY_DN1561_c1_g1_i2:324-1007(-)